MKPIKQAIIEDLFGSVDDGTPLSNFFEDMNIKGKFDQRKFIEIVLLLIIRLDSLEKKVR